MLRGAYHRSATNRIVKQNVGPRSYAASGGTVCNILVGLMIETIEKFWEVLKTTPQEHVHNRQVEPSVDKVDDVNMSHDVEETLPITVQQNLKKIGKNRRSITQEHSIRCNVLERDIKTESARMGHDRDNFAYIAVIT